MNEMQQFDAYMAHLCAGLGHVDRHAGLRGYCMGLIWPLARKRLESVVAHVNHLRPPSRQHALHHFIADANWSDEEMLRRVAQWVTPLMDFSDGGWWVVHDIAVSKQGMHSVGVAKQYCEMLGRQVNCQLAVGVSLACEAASLPMMWSLYLPKEWAHDPLRRRKAGVPETATLTTKPAMALQQIEQLLARGEMRRCVLAESEFGADQAFRERLSQLGLKYAVAVTGAEGVLPLTHDLEGLRPQESCALSGEGLRLSDLRTMQAEPKTAIDVAHAIGVASFRKIVWSEGTNDSLCSLFARVRVQSFERFSCQVQWLLIEWSEGHVEPTKFWLSTLPEEMPLERMVYEVKMRWRIERDYQKLKQDLGLGQFEGRGWRGFHHHASLSIAAYGYLFAKRLRLTEGADGPRKLSENPASISVSLMDAY